MPTTTRVSQQLTEIDKKTLDLGVAATRIAATVRAAGAAPDATGSTGVTAGDLLDALTLLHWVQGELTVIEPALIAAARQAGASWQTLAPVLGVASRQAAERRYLRLVPAATDAGGSTGDGRVRAERDRRAGHRAVAQWANDHTADLRRLAGQITGLADLDDDAATPIDRLHRALADIDASALPSLLADVQRHLHHHPDLADQVDSVTARSEQVRRHTQQHRDSTAS